MIEFINLITLISIKHNKYQPAIRIDLLLLVNRTQQPYFHVNLKSDPFIINVDPSWMSHPPLHLYSPSTR